MPREGNRDTLKIVCMLKPRDARITHERTGHATYDPSSQQGAEVKILVDAGPRGETSARSVHRKGATFEDLELFLKALQTRYGNIPVYCHQEECLREVVHIRIANRSDSS